MSAAQECSLRKHEHLGQIAKSTTQVWARSLLKEQSETPVSPGLPENAQLPGSVSYIALWKNLGFYCKRRRCVLVFSLPVSGVLNTTLPQESGLQDISHMWAPLSDFTSIQIKKAFQVDLFISEK